MCLRVKISSITDKLSYSQAYAPDYPLEDRTDLQREENVIKQAITELKKQIRREDVSDWIRLGEMSVEKAFNYFRNGDEMKGSWEIETAITYFENAAAKKTYNVDFIVGPDGPESVE